jgi:hypothetical protein
MRTSFFRTLLDSPWKEGTVLRLAVLVLVWLAGAVRAAAEDDRWQISLASYLSEGEYGTDVTTRFVYTPLSVRRMFRKGDLTLVVPHLILTSDTTVFVFRGIPQRRRPGAPAPAGRGDGRQPTETPPTPVAQRQTTRETGIGDVALVGRYFLAEARGARTTVDLTARLELPTGDEARGLGLGKPSFEAGVQISKTLGRSFVGLVDGGYSFVGRPEGVTVQDTWEYAIGLGWYLARPLLVSASYEAWRPVVPGLAEGRDLLIGANLRASAALRIQASARVKLSDTAPDFTVGGGLGVRF